MEKHTVCLLNDSFPPVIDGVANAVVNYAENLGKLGGNAIVATPAVPGADDSVFSFPVLRYPAIDTRKLLGYVSGYPFSPEVLARLTEERTAILHAHCPVSSLIMARSLRDVLDAPLVMTYHTKYDIDIAKAVRGRLLQDSLIRAMVQNIRSCDEVWVVSRGAGENLRSLGYDGDYVVMENGVDMPLGTAAERDVQKAASGYDLPDGVPVFLFVGRLMWYKGLRIILDALKKIGDAGIDFRAVIIGDGTDGGEIRDYASELGLGGRCFFTGAIADRETVRAWYSRADLFLFPSTFDTNGLVVREAAACGTPTVMIAGSCAAEGVTDGRNGFFIEENADAMAACLQRLAAEPDAVRRVGENAARELYVSWETAVGRAAERYETVLDNYHGGVYDRRRNTMDEFLKTQGELMEAIAGLERERRELQAEFSETRDEIRTKVTAAKDAIWEKIDRYL